MKTVAILLIFSVIWSCKQKPVQDKIIVEQPVQKKEVVQQLPPVIKQLLKFVDITAANTADVGQVFEFKKIDTSGVVTTIDMDEAISLYKSMMKHNPPDASPIFEVKDMDNAILLIQGSGFGGPIWAKVLVDRTTLEIKKIEFDHKAESEEYASVMKGASFEDQFVGTKINLDKNTFNLQKEIEKRSDSGQIIEGISGATMTSQGVVEMVNLGLQKYRKYLKKP